MNEDHEPVIDPDTPWFQPDWLERNLHWFPLDARVRDITSNTTNPTKEDN